MGVKALKAALAELRSTNPELAYEAVLEFDWLMSVLLLHGSTDPTDPNGTAWHTHDCWANNRASCTGTCSQTRAALASAGVPLP